MPGHWLWLAPLALMLAACVATDVRDQRIPNALVAGGAVAGILLSLLPQGVGIANSAIGLAAGFALLLPLYLLRAMGAGDVKLMAAVGAFVGWPGIAPVVLYTFLAGGVLSIAGAIAARNLGGVLSNIRTGAYLALGRVAAGRLPTAAEFPLSRQRMPYALAIAAGTGAHLIAKGLGS